MTSSAAGPSGLILRDRAGPAAFPMHSPRGITGVAGDAQGRKPHIAHDGALPAPRLAAEVRAARLPEDYPTGHHLFHTIHAHELARLHGAAGARRSRRCRRCRLAAAPLRSHCTASCSRLYTRGCAGKVQAERCLRRLALRLRAHSGWTRAHVERRPGATAWRQTVRSGQGDWRESKSTVRLRGRLHGAESLVREALRRPLRGAIARVSATSWAEIDVCAYIGLRLLRDGARLGACVLAVNRERALS